MNPIAADAGTVPSATAGILPDARSAAQLASGEFDQWMDGLTATAPPRPPSLLGSMVRMPSDMSNQVMASVTAPPPPNMSLVQTIRDAAQKSVDLNNMKTLNSLVISAAKLTRKTVETVLNNK
ncbi:hypothetical protein [Xylophilus sp. GOD-11R]|uniref:hypothetical protein n=1 Tax=Xylophilus sp. GOD-11R TaxID=3089814 RepID=UPI00298D5E30|nr:hypothetical protein [Xylophilus sp. GOD-11R]WPB57939.1 hypothetical protein R9X41_04645 [Xylophilus sp. GOD-11R]